MAKQQKTIILAIMGVLLLIVGAVFFFNKKLTSPANPASQQNQASQTKKQQQMVNDFLNSSDPDLRAIATSTNQKTPAPTAISKIEAKFKDGEISAAKYLKLKTLAMFAPDKLPAEFKSQTSARLQGDRIIAEIIDYNDQLDAATKGLLAPFTLPPDDPNSFFNPAADKEKIITNLTANLR